MVKYIHTAHYTFRSPNPSRLATEKGIRPLSLAAWGLQQHFVLYGRRRHSWRDNEMMMSSSSSISREHHRCPVQHNDTLLLSTDAT